MVRRLATSALWFLAFFCLHELVWATAGSPRPLGLAVGALAAAFVWVDPIARARAARTMRAETVALDRSLESR